jgi:hypothetical protein
MAELNLSALAETIRKEIDDRLLGVYRDRNLAVQLAAYFAEQAGHTVGWGVDEELPDGERWPVLFINLVDGPRMVQLSWHIAADDKAVELPPYEYAWDGHTEDEKIERVRRFLESDGQGIAL